jgi:hypothetical protein
MIPLQPIHVLILSLLVRYCTLTRMQLEGLCLPGKSDGGRRMRKHLTTLRHAGLICQTNGRVVFPERNGAPAPVYHISRMGAERLAAELKDDSVLHACVLTPSWMSLYHWVRIADFRILFDRAVALQPDDLADKVCTDHWLTEWMVANPGEKAPEKRYSLFTLLQETPRLVCAPDASFLVSYRGFFKAVYVEIDRQTSGINAISHSKTPGYAKLAETRQHVRHFPGLAADVPFTFLHVSPSAARRDQIARAIKGKPGEKLWKFVAWADLTPQTALHDEILRDVDLKAMPLVRRAGGASK